MNSVSRLELHGIHGLGAGQQFDAETKATRHQLQRRLQGRRWRYTRTGAGWWTRWAAWWRGASQSRRRPARCTQSRWSRGRSSAARRTEFQHACQTDRPVFHPCFSAIGNTSQHRWSSGLCPPMGKIRLWSEIGRVSPFFHLFQVWDAHQGDSIERPSGTGVRHRERPGLEASPKGVRKQPGQSEEHHQPHGPPHAATDVFCYVRPFAHGSVNLADAP